MHIWCKMIENQNKDQGKTQDLTAEEEKVVAIERIDKDQTHQEKTCLQTTRKYKDNQTLKLEIEKDQILETQLPETNTTKTIGIVQDLTVGEENKIGKNQQAMIRDKDQPTVRTKTTEKDLTQEIQTPVIGKDQHLMIENRTTLEKQ